MPLIKITPTDGQALPEQPPAPPPPPAEPASLAPETPPDTALTVLPDVPPEETSARHHAASAITEYQRLADEVSLEKAREAYTHLMIGRGFDRKERALRESGPLPKPPEEKEGES